ncbi:MAG: serine hydrolase [Desulfobacula sp.]|jgi:CubicO group peptidase (beta-lactamase class C family)
MDLNIIRKDKIGQEFEAAISEGIFPGAVFLCALGHRIIFHEAFGMADLFENRKMRKNTIFDLASLTKPLATTLAIAKLIEQGKLSVDRKISNILTEFQNTDKSNITIDMLLRHTSGLPSHRNYYLEILHSNENPSQCLRNLIIKEKLESKIGEKEVYSDLGFMILAWIIERVSGRRIDQFVSHEIYMPLGIERLLFMELSPANKKFKLYKGEFAATQHCPWRNKVLTGEVDDDNAYAVGGIDGHAGLFGDALSVYAICSEILKAIQNKASTVLMPDIIKDFVQRDKAFGRVAGFDTPSKEGSSSGRFFSDFSVGHLGFTGTSFWIDPENGLIIVLLTNRVHPSRSNEGIKKFRPKIHDLVRIELMENKIDKWFLGL